MTSCILGTIVLMIGSIVELGLPQGPSGIVSGRVLSADGRASIRDVRITATDGEREATTRADAEGRYELRLAPGRYWIRAEREHWFSTYLGQRSPADIPESVLIENTTHRTGANIFMIPLGILVGRVIDRHGDPVERAMVTAASADLRVTQTDDLGHFRIPRLLPGQYFLSVVPPPSPPPLGKEDPYGVTFAPSTSDPNQAQPISVGSGETAPVEIALISARPQEVSGLVLTAAGTPAGGAEVSLNIEQAARSNSVSISRGFTQTAADGTFLFPRVSPGTYRLRAHAGEETASADVIVSGAPIQGLTIIMARAVTLNGQLILDAPMPRDCLKLAVLALPLEPGEREGESVRHGAVDSNSRFRLTGLSGRRWFEVRCERRAAVAAIRGVSVDGRDFGTGPVDMNALPQEVDGVVRATPLSNRLYGRVSDEAGLGCSGIVAAADVDEKKWRPPFSYLRTTPTVNGDFELRALPPGRYFVFFEPPRRVGEVLGPDYLRIVKRRGIEAEIGVGDAVQVNLRCR